MSMAYLVSMKSKDPRTKIGSIIVGPDNEVVSIGYNGICRGVCDNIPMRDERPDKYFYYEHSERNSLYNAARIGVSTKGCKIYTQGIPCADCARGIIQSGIVEVIVHKGWNDKNGQKWIESAKFSKKMFVEACVSLTYYEGPIISKIVGLNNGVEINLD